jgi:hypothetical protein
MRHQANGSYLDFNLIYLKVRTLIYLFVHMKSNVSKSTDTNTSLCTYLMLYLLSVLRFYGGFLSIEWNNAKQSYVM